MIRGCRPSLFLNGTNCVAGTFPDRIIGACKSSRCCLLGSRIVSACAASLLSSLRRDGVALAYSATNRSSVALYGTESAYLPTFLRSHGLPLEQIGLVLAAGTIVRIVAGPAAGRLADHLRAHKMVVTTAAGLSGVIGLAYIGFAPLLAVSMAHAAVTASLAPLSDALSVTASDNGRTFQYGWVRGAGSAAFVAGTLLSAQLIDRFGLSSIIVSSSILFLVMALCAMRITTIAPLDSTENTGSGAYRALWYGGVSPPYRRRRAGDRKSCA
jgi:MFS family permease